MNHSMQAAQGAQARPRCRLLDGYGALSELRARWQALCDRCPWTTPFQRPDWLMPWARCFGPAEPWLFAVHAGERLVGLAPLFRYRPAGRGPGQGDAARGAPGGDQDGRHDDGDRVLALLGAGISDYLDVPIEPGWERPVLAAVLAELDARRARWDVCVLDELRPGSPLVSALAPDRNAPATAAAPVVPATAAAVPAVVPATPARSRGLLPPSWSAQAAARSVCPVLALPPRVEQLARCVPRRHLERFHQYRRRALRHGALRLERAAPADARGRERLLDGLFRLHEARWRRCGAPGVLAGTAMHAFHGEVAAGFAARDALALYGLWLDDRLIACLYGFFEARTLYFYLSGFDPDAAHLSPGTLIVGLVIEDAIRRGMGCFDFLRGSEPYKRRWGAEERGTVRVRLRWSARSGHGVAVHG